MPTTKNRPPASRHEKELITAWRALPDAERALPVGALQVAMKAMQATGKADPKRVGAFSKAISVLTWAGTGR